jgi:hypothetical protein
MEKLRVICYIRSAGPNVSYLNMRDTLKSIHENINTSYKFYITTDTNDHKNEFQKIIEEIGIKDYVLNIDINTNSWATCFNTFYELNKNLCDYILVSHDDLIVRTFDFFNITMYEISGYEEIVGWIGFTSDSYYRISNKLESQSAREVFCKDRMNYPHVFELHNMVDRKYEESKLDMPNRACKVPGIYSHFNMIKSSNLEKIGLCPDWGNYTLLIDEHWSLQSLIRNFWTIWVPNVFYDHPIRLDNRIVKDLQNHAYTTEKFISHWGIEPAGLNDEQINKFCEKYPDSNISFFNDKFTYDYQYLKI